MHIHLAINKIHPKKLTLHAPYNDFKQLGQLCEELEDKHGLQPDNHQAAKRGDASRATDMEKNAGVESLLGWIQRTCLEDLLTATSWQELHGVLAANGLKLQQRGNGLVVRSLDENEPDVAVKASSIARDFSKAKLEQRFGAYVSDTSVKADTIQHNYEASPIAGRAGTQALYDRYQSEQLGLKDHRADKLSSLVDRKNKLVAGAYQRNKLRRAAIKMIRTDRTTKKLLHYQAYKALQRDKNRITHRYQRQRQRVYQQHQRQAWSDWLCKQAIAGDAQCLQALRTAATQQPKNAKNCLSGEAVTLFPKSLPAHTQVDSITKQGTIIYRVGNSTVRETQNTLEVSRLTSIEDVGKVLELSVMRFGNGIAIYGDDAFKQQFKSIAANGNLPCQLQDTAKAESGNNNTQDVTHLAKSYIAEREQKRQNGLDISNHTLYKGKDGEYQYAGIRTLEGHVLALLKDDSDTVQVMAVNKATGYRLKRLKIGDSVSVENGTVYTSKAKRQRL